MTIEQISAAEKKGKGRPFRASPVVTSLASEQFLAPTIQVPGTVVSRQQSQLPAEVAGRLIWVADVGTRIKKGEPVAKLDDTLYRLRVEENKATLKREEARLKFLDKELSRLEELIKNDFSSKNSLDKVILDRDVAQSEVVVAKAKIRVDEETLTRYVVNSPFDGIIINRQKREGEWIDGGETVVTLSNPKLLEIEARVSEKSVSHIHVGNKLQIKRGEETKDGKVSAIVPIGDSGSHLYDMRIELPKSKWLAGQVVRVSVPTGKSSKVLAVPRDALVLRSEGISVFRIGKDKKAEKIEVKTGIASGDFIQVIADLQVGDEIVTRGNERLRPGQTVNVLSSK